MKKKLLVANRSEIACRIFQAARERGLATVAIVAPGDEQARHVTFADEVVAVPSYLDIDAIIAAAKDTGAYGIHPGYGFLSERPAFVEAVEKAGLVFLGPEAATMKLMGGKVAAKKLAEKIGVPTAAWAEVKAGSDLAPIAQKIGFPLLIKASAGGGGKGMRRVERAQDLNVAAESAVAEVKSAFGDPTIFLEYLVNRGRHIEVQVFGDGKGGGVALFERECSLQRRHQKVWEEARAPRLAEKTRKILADSALKIVRETRYRSAGTVEFLVDAKENVFFLEMNTRLQVEHPVTECVTGHDLVCAQIDLSMGQLANVEKTLSPPVHEHGHAIEVRLYAEDPSQGFIPCTGLVTDLVWPQGPGIRVDSGVEIGQEIHTLFDSMLAKIIVHAPNREHALARLKRALSETVVLGVGTNLSYLQALVENPRVQAADVHTQFLDEEFSFSPKVQESDLLILSELVEKGLARSGLQATGATGSSAGFASPWYRSEKGSGV